MFVIKQPGEHQRHVIRSKTTGPTGNIFLFSFLSIFLKLHTSSVDFTAIFKLKQQTWNLAFLAFRSVRCPTGIVLRANNRKLEITVQVWKRQRHIQVAVTTEQARQKAQNEEESLVWLFFSHPAGRLLHLHGEGLLSCCVFSINQQKSKNSVIRIIIQLCSSFVLTPSIKVRTFFPLIYSTSNLPTCTIHCTKYKNQFQMCSNLIKKIHFLVFPSAKKTNKQSIRGMLQVRGDSYARTYNQPREMFVWRLLLVTAFIGAVSFIQLFTLDIKSKLICHPHPNLYHFRQIVASIQSYLGSRLSNEFLIA